jgi:transcriptional regulator with XRE-family HTH domain
MQALSYSAQNHPYIADMANMGRPTSRKRTAFGNRIHEAREQLGISQKQLADKIGVSQRVLSWWEREPVALKTEQLAALAQALNVSADFLLGRKATPPKPKGPKGRMRELFEVASSLPRKQQEKVAAVLEPFVLHHAANASNGR